MHRKHGGQMPSSSAAAVLRPGERNELEIGVVLQRNFIGLANDEFTELTVLTEGARWIWQCSSVESHIEGLRRGQQLKGFVAAFMLHNRPLDPKLAARYEQDTWIRAPQHRASDKDIATRTSIYVDCDAIRPAGISSTDDEFRAALDVSWKVRDWLASELGPYCLGQGISGNGAFLLIAVEPEPEPPAWTVRISTFLKLLNKKFSTDLVKIDCSRAVEN